MIHGAISQAEQWGLLGAFFVMFAISGLNSRARRPLQCIPSLAAGMLIIAANLGLLTLANHFANETFNIFQLITLQSIAVESSLVIIGYCLIVRALAILTRTLLQAPAADTRRHGI